MFILQIEYRNSVLLDRHSLNSSINRFPTISDIDFKNRSHLKGHGMVLSEALFNYEPLVQNYIANLVL